MCEVLAVAAQSAQTVYMQTQRIHAAAVASGVGVEYAALLERDAEREWIRASDAHWFARHGNDGTPPTATPWRPWNHDTDRHAISRTRD